MADWLVKVDGEVLLNTEDLTFDELGVIEETSGIGWMYLNPNNATGVARALLALALIKSGMADAAARDKVGQMTKREFRDAFELVVEGVNDDRPKEWVDGLPDPKEATGSSTSGSSGAEKTSAKPGPRT